MSLLTRLQMQHLQTLHAAQSLMRTGQVEQAEPEYYHALKKDLVGFYQHPNAPHQWYLGQEGQPSLDAVALSVIEYYFQNLDWTDWNPLCQLVLSHPDYPTLPIDTRVRLEAVRAYSLLLNSLSLETYIKNLESMLELQNLHPVTIIICHYVLSRMYLLQRNKARVHKHLKQALYYSQSTQQTFFHSFILEAIATIYYFLNQHRRSYYEIALEKYREAEAFVRAHNNGFDYTHNPYNTGWVHAELREYDEALSEFQRGFAELENPDTLYIGAQYRYGMGYVYLSIQRYDEALDYLLKAMDFFWGRSYVNTAACLNLMADVYRQNANITKAIDCLENAASNLQRADHPVQLHHVYRQFSSIYFSRREFLQAARYFVKVYRLRLQYKMPLLPY